MSFGKAIDIAGDIEKFNAPQKEAVLTVKDPLLVLAGAGSGKTRVLTYRIANLIGMHHVSPWNILAVTFTNKAAAEMRERLTVLLGAKAKGMWVSTFHSICVRILREHAETLGFTKHFTIYNADDQKRLVKEIATILDINLAQFPVHVLMGRISTLKNDLVTPQEFAAQVIDPVGERVAQVYTKLQESLRAANAFDFDDLLLYTFLLFKKHPHVLAQYQDRFQYIMVDEYQDTNHAQYQLSLMLAAKHKNIMVVGDDDQSIYSWRGADITNILNFEKDYKNAKVVKLEQNYRCTNNILQSANAVIHNNTIRKHKTLFTSNADGDKIKVHSFANGRGEANWIVQELKLQAQSGTPYNEMAVLYRTNMQSRLLEEQMLLLDIPYVIVGGVRFFDRAEVRDIIAYLTLLVNPADDIAAKRVINLPRRGIGKSTIERIESVAREKKTTFLEAAYIVVANKMVRTGACAAIANFLYLLERVRETELDLQQTVQALLDETEIIKILREENSDDAISRLGNISEFLNVVREYSNSIELEEETPSLDGLLSWIQLRTDMDTVDTSNSVSLMTVHSSKGLEFDCVFLAGLEETIFPHKNSLEEELGVEEERRLAYVAITRARKKLWMTYAFNRDMFGSPLSSVPSRFLDEVPEKLCEKQDIW